MHPHRRLLTRFFVAFLLGLLAVLGIGVGALYAYDQQYQGRILPGVQVGDVDLVGPDPGRGCGAAPRRLRRARPGRRRSSSPAATATRHSVQPRSAASPRSTRWSPRRCRSAGPATPSSGSSPTPGPRSAASPSPRQVRYDQDGPDPAGSTPSPPPSTLGTDRRDDRRPRRPATWSPTSVTGRKADPTTGPREPRRSQLAPRRRAGRDPRRPAAHRRSSRPITTDAADAAVAAADRIAADVRVVHGKDHWTIPAATSPRAGSRSATAATTGARPRLRHREDRHGPQDAARRRQPGARNDAAPSSGRRTDRRDRHQPRRPGARRAGMKAAIVGELAARAGGRRRRRRSRRSSRPSTRS